MARITFVGGGSYSWMPSILGRLFKTESFQNDHITIMDSDAQAADDIYQLALGLRKRFKSSVGVSRTTSLAESLDGADYVSLTISTGGLEAMRVDLEVPEKFGIYHTVGDTVGPGGMSRALRNVPVMVQLGRQMEKLCPKAWLLNLSNPLSTLTRAVSRETKIRTAGLCQGVVEHVDYLVRLLGEEPGRDVQFITAGIDHCPWLLDLKIRGRDGIQMLREKGLCSADLRSNDVGDTRDGHLNILTGTRAGFALWKETGFLPGIGDRHIVENFGCFITDKAEIEKYGIVRTTIADRTRNRQICKERVHNLVKNPDDLRIPDTHAPVIQMIDALEGRKDLLTTLNVENVGQIPELPARANVETLCHVDRLGVHPLAIGRPLPAALDVIVRPHILRQEGSIDAALNGDFELAVSLLASDPLVRRVTDARAMLKEMIDRNREWLPNFQK
jgi:alpha-galactosidase/6-phospho-beta-glucosidase family protein